MASIEEKKAVSLFQNASAYATLKTQLKDLTEQQHHQLKALSHLTEQFTHSRDKKTSLTPQQYCRETRAILTEIELYFRNLTVRITSFPILSNLSKLLQTIIEEYNTIFSSTQNYWLTLTKNLRKQIHQQPVGLANMEMCLNCSENIRQQEIKQARYQLNNPVTDPFLFFSAATNHKPEPFEETRQKELQDKLSELANNVETGQNFIREMLQQMSINSSQTWIGTPDRQTERDSLPIMSFVRSVYNKVRKERKEPVSIGVQTFFVEKHRIQMLDIPHQKEVTDRLTKRQSQIQKISSCKELQLKLAQTQKELVLLKNEISVLKNMNHTLQAVNVDQEMEITMLKVQRDRPQRQYQNTKSLTRKTDKTHLSPQYSVEGNQTANEKTIIERKRKSYRTEARLKKGEMMSSMASPPIQPGRGLTGSTNGRRQSKIFRNADLTMSLKRQNSSDSIMNLQDDYIDEGQGMEVLLSPPPIQLSHESKRVSQNTETIVQESQRTIGTLKRVSGALANNQKLSSNQKKRLRDMIRSQQVSPDVAIKKKARRQAQIYNRDDILKIIYEQEVKNREQSIEFQEFKATCNTFISKAVTQPKETEERGSHKNKDKMHILMKKGAKGLKQKLRSDIVNSHKSPKQQIEGSYQRATHIKSRASHNSLNLEDIASFDDRNSDNWELPRLRSKLFINTDKIDKKSSLQRHEHQIMTQLMAYLIQLKSSHRNNYQAVKRLLSFDNKCQHPERQQEKEALKSNIAHLIIMHRGCPHTTRDLYCGHLKELVNSIVKMLL